MAQRVQGTEDLFGGYMRAWQRVCDVAREVFGTYGFDAVETPVLEQVDTFVHGIGESTDVVRKEMFRALSGALMERVLAEGSEQGLKPKQRIALRPEGTAGFVRAAAEMNLVPEGAAPVKAWYAGSMFRGERPQKGRLRQFHQVGAEVLGAQDPAIDAEVIIMCMEFFERLGFARDNLALRINSMGDASCRPAYREKVRDYILSHADEMCDDCLERAQINPLRAFDCKNDHCREVMRTAPLAPQHLCDNCATHYEQVKRYLHNAGVHFEEDPTLVRGLDYYTRTVFEIDARGAESVGAIGGGGRYDGLMELVGGKPTPGIGFAVGFERIVLALDALQKPLAPPQENCIFVACTDNSLRETAFSVCATLRAQGLRTEADYQGRSLKSQFKLADRLQAAYTVILGPDELEQQLATLRDMHTHEQKPVPLSSLAQELALLMGVDTA